MRRIEAVYNEINEIQKGCGFVPAVYTHLFQVAQLCSLIALRRGENAELATIAGALHDIVYMCSNDKTLKYSWIPSSGHAENSALIAERILTEQQLVTPEECRIICNAINLHADKEHTGTAYDEVLKDADVFAHGLYDITSGNFRTDRWDALCVEFNIKNPKELFH